MDLGSVIDAQYDDVSPNKEWSSRDILNEDCDQY